MSEKDQTTSRSTTAGDSGSQEPFLRRWARLKADAEKEQAGPGAAPAAGTPEAGVPAGDCAVEGPPEDAAEPGADTAPGTEASPPGEEELPPLEALDENSDYSAFMSSRVSASMRKQALRKLFRSAKFNYICELDDYIDDYTSFPALGDMITADMKHAAARLLEKQLQAAEEEGAEAVAAVAADDSAEGAAGDERVADAGDDPERERTHPRDRTAAVPGEDPGPNDANEDNERDA